MMSVTVNAFPPFQSMNSPRGWVLAIIVLLHAGFFWLLTSGMGARIVGAIHPKDFDVINVPVIDEPIKRIKVDDYKIDPAKIDPITILEPEGPVVDNPEHNERVIEGATSTEVPVVHGGGTAQIELPVTLAPAIDPKAPLSEPEYPATEIRMGHTGTVLLSVFVLENGRVGEVKVEQSSGFQRLDTAATREAKKWRFKPGTQDGLPVGMWKQIPITFQLKK